MSYTVKDKRKKLPNLTIKELQTGRTYIDDEGDILIPLEGSNLLYFLEDGVEEYCHQEVCSERRFTQVHLTINVERDV